MNPVDLGALADALADRIADRIVDKLRAGEWAGWVDQAASPLGRRTHINAIREGRLRGVCIGRRYLAKREDVERYASEVAGRPRKARARGGREAEIAAELGLEVSSDGKRRAAG